MVDGADSKSAEGNLMRVRVPPSAPVRNCRAFCSIFYSKNAALLRSQFLLHRPNAKYALQFRSVLSCEVFASKFILVGNLACFVFFKKQAEDSRSQVRGISSWQIKKNDAYLRDSWAAWNFKLSSVLLNFLYSNKKHRGLT